jgi:hypothetical protein
MGDQERNRQDCRSGCQWDHYGGVELLLGAIL